ncbi:hypothetical protein [Nocardia arthritidis]|uniref:hypothetical protein n=1 Tax=Nocardia arthritidis TaxID=228602 RepID=UPI0007A54C9A|nr:hypothetical protein [Nocardia arthritidis]
MMAVVWLIDVLVIVVKILGGRTEVNPVLRAGMWVAVLSLFLAGCAVLVALVVLLQRWLEGLA